MKKNIKKVFSNNTDYVAIGILTLLATIPLALFLTYKDPQISTISPSSQTGAVSDFNSSLVAHYTFDDGSGSDSSSNSISGNVSGATLVSGKIGSGALNFDGVDDGVTLTVSNSLNNTSELTLSAWIYKTVANGYQTIIRKGPDDYVLMTVNNELEFAFYNSGWTNIRTSGANIPLNTWSQVLVSFSNSTNELKMYLNGAVVSSSVVQKDLLIENNAMEFGTVSYLGGLRWSGYLDDVRIYNKILSNSEVNELYALGGSSSGESDPGSDMPAPPNPSSSPDPVPLPNQQVSGEDFYISQNGGGTGSSCSNARALTWLNDISNWGIAAGKIGEDDTVHLCGTLTATVGIHGSGSSGKPITLVFESGTKMVAPTWYNPAIYMKGRSHIVVDGGSNGLIQATASGSGFNNTGNSAGVVMDGSNNIEVKNLTILGMYVRNPSYGDNCNNNCGSGIFTGNTFSNISIHDNTITDARTGIGLSYAYNTSNLSIYSNKISRTAWGIGGGDWPPNGSNLTNVDIYDNTITDAYPWDGNFSNCTGDCWFHINGIYIWAEQTGNSLSNIKIHGNKIGGNMGNASHITSFTWFSGNVQAPVKVYNNVYYSTSDSGSASNGFISIRACKNGTSTKPCGIYNNTFYSKNSAGLGVMVGDSSEIYNNIFYNVAQQAVYAGDPSNTYSIKSNNNLFYGLVTNQFKLNGGYAIPTTWKSWGFDVNSLFVDPQFTNPSSLDFSLKSTSPAIGAGQNLYSLFTDDYDGNRRSSGGVWDIGANISSGGNITQPPPSTAPSPVIPPVIPIDTTSPTIPLNLVATLTNSNTATLTWSGSTDSVGVTGYRIYRDGNLLTTVTNTTYVNSNLTPNTTYTYAIAAYDAAGNASNQSISKTIVTPPLPDTTAPTITNIQTSNITPTSVNISWTTNELSTTQVSYGNTNTLGTNTTLETTPTLNHLVSLVGLNPNTTYYYSLKSTDASGNTKTSPIQSVKTLEIPVSVPGDIEGPGVLNLSITNITSEEASLSITTNEASIVKLYYGTNPSTLNAISADTDLNTTHTLKFTNLTRNTIYYYKLEVEDKNGNKTESETKNFKTNSRLIKPPKVLNVKARPGSIILSWTNPEYEYVEKIMIFRSVDGYLGNITEGSKVGEVAKNMNIWTDTNTEENTTYFYSIFTIDDEGTASDPTFIAYKPEKKKIIPVVNASPDVVLNNVPKNSPVSVINNLDENLNTPVNPKSENTSSRSTSILDIFRPKPVGTNVDSNSGDIPLPGELTVPEYVSEDNGTIVKNIVGEIILDFIERIERGIEKMKEIVLN